MAGTSERKGVDVGDVAGFHNQLTGAEMPPQIGIDGIAGRHGEKAK
jgi:hypothetical protein